MFLTRNSRTRWGQILLLAACGILACLPAVGWTQVNYYWNGAPGSQDWGNPANWNPTGGPAVNGDNAYLYAPGDNNYIVNYNTQAPNLGDVFINHSPSLTNTLTLRLGQAGLALQANVVSVGDKVQGMLHQTAGTLTVPQYLYVGNAGGSTGTYTLAGTTGNTILDTAQSYVGNLGIGYFNQDGGTHTVANELNVGYRAGSTGTYTLDSGAVNPQLLFVGYSGTGTFHQNGGTVTINDHLGVGRETGSVGEYNLNAGNFTTQDLYVGWSGQGTFNKNGGTLNVNGSIYMATRDTRTGIATFNLGVGNLTAANLEVGLNGVGTFNQSSGTTLTIGSSVTPGILGVNSQAGTSIFNQNGGDTTVFGNIEVGREPGSQGQYILNGGTLTTQGSLYLGYQGTGTFTQTGGTHSVYSISLGEQGNGTYNLEGGSVTANDLFVGIAGGTGSFNQSGASTATFNSSLSVVNSSYNLSDGNLIALDIFVGDSGAGNFNQSGGTVTINNHLWIGRNTGTGIFELTNGNVTFVSPTGATSMMFLGDAGTGTFNQYGGNVNLSGGTLQLGVATGGVGTYNLNDGQLQVGTIDLAVYGVSPPVTGTFNQSGGTLNADTINLNPGGTFNQAGGSLNCTTFNQQGGQVLGNLENRGTYNYFNGDFTGRLLNYGVVNIISATFTAGDGMAQLNSSTPITLTTGSLTLNGRGLEVDQGAAFIQTGGSLTTTDTIIGNTGIGTFTQTGGTHTVNNPSTLTLGAEAGSTGTYNLQLNGVLNTNNTIVGNFGTGIFNQTGGTHTVTNDLSLGHETGGQGTYSLQNGDLSTTNTYVGFNGAGTFEQTGGTHTVANDLSLGNAASSIGTYNLSGGTLSTTNTTIGNASGGIFRQSGNSSHAVNGALTLGTNPNSSGGYTLDGGTLTTTTTEVGLSGGGNFNQFGDSSHTVTGTLTLGVNSGSDGNYLLEGGSLSGTSTTLSTTNTVVGNLGTGTFTQEGTDSSHTVSNDLIVGADNSGLYSLNAGTLQTNRTIVGQNGSGTFYHNDQFHSVNTDLILGSGSNGQGSYDIMYGQVNTGNLTVGLNGQGTFTQNQHTGVHVVNTITLGANAGSSGTYNLGGSFSSLEGHLVAAQGVVGDAGTGTFTQNLGRFTVNTDLILGQQTGGSGTYLFSEGTLEAGNLIVGRYGTGSFTQSGGTNTLSGDLTLAQNGGSSGTYNLSGGTLTTVNIFLNTNGIFNQTGGSLTYTDFYHRGGEVQGNLENRGTYHFISGTFTGRLTNYGTLDFLAATNTFTAGNGLAHLSGTPVTLDTGQSLILNGQGLEVDQGATFNQTGGSLNTTNTIVGNTGTGTFTQNGGSQTISNTLTLAANTGSTGTYNLLGGTLTAAAINVNAGGTFTQTGGTLIPSNTFTVGAGGNFSQTGGIVDGTSNTIFITEGTCNLSNGTFRPGNTMSIGTGGSFTQTGGLVDGLSNTIIITEGTFNLGDGSVRPGNSMTIRNGGTFNQSGGLVDGASNTISIFEGTCTVNGGTYNAGNLYLYTGGSFYWNGGNFSYNTLNLQGGNFYGSLNNFGMISGAGTITGNVTNSGTVSPGNSPGVLNIVGSFTQTAAGNYVMEMASASSYDQIKVTGTPGTATVGGTLSPVLLGGFTPAWNQVFPGIITASGGITPGSTFSTINSNLSWLVQYNSNSIDLRVGGYNFANPNFALTANQRHVGIMLNQVADTASGDLGTVLSDLALLPAGAVGNAYQQISPDKASALPSLSLAGSMMQWQSLANRLSYQRWRQGGLPNLAGGRSGSFNLSYDKLAGLMLAYNGADLSGMGSALRPPADSAGTWGVFTDFVSSFGSLDSTANDTGYNFTIFGFTAGADYRLRDDLVIGLGTGYYNTSASYKNSGGDAGINSIPFYAYGAYTPGSFYAMGSLGYTLNLYSLDRNIVFGGINRVATSSVNGNQLNASLETGYDFKVAQFTLTPALTVYYSQAWVNGFTESGAGSLDLNVNSQSANSVQTGLGMRLSRPFQSGSTLLLPQVYAFYQHEFANDSRGLDARLAQAGSTFAFQTDSPSRDFAVLGAGVAVGLRKNLTLQANYNAEVGRRGYTPMMVSAGLRYEF